MKTLSGNTKIWMEVDDSEVIEYIQRREGDDLKKKTLCYIEAVEGKAFEIHYEHIPLDPDHQTEVELSIDGRIVDSHRYCSRLARKPVENYFDGFRERKDISTVVVRPFVFGKVEVTAKGKLEDTPKHLRDEGCTIQVKVNMYKSGFKEHYNLRKIKSSKKLDQEEEAKSDAMETPCVHEDTKPAFVGLLTQRGPISEILNLKGGGTGCYCPKEGNDVYHQVFIFQYRSTSWITSQGYKMDSKADLELEEGPSGKMDKCKEKSIEVLTQKKDSAKKNVLKENVNTHKAEDGTVNCQKKNASHLPRKRAGSEPIVGSHRSTTLDNSNFRFDMTVPKKIKVENASGPRIIQIDLTENDDGCKVNIPSPVIYEISDDD